MIIQANDSFSSGKSQSYSLGGKTGLVVHKALSTLATTVAEFGDCCRIRRQSPFSATVAEFTQKYGGIGVGP